MSELCKIESPISLHLMSLNFEEKKERGNGKHKTRENRSGRKAEWERCFVLGES